MKNIKFILIIFLFGSIFESCSDSLLDLKQPINPSSSTFYTDTLTAYQGLVGCYNSLQQIPGGGVLKYMEMETRTDDQDYGGNPKAKSEETNYYEAAGFANFEIFTDNPFSSDIWGYSYAGINVVNQYLNSLSQLSLKTPKEISLLANYRATALVIRSYYYFLLVKNFGDVPLITSLLPQSEWYIQRRSPEKDIYAQIFKDLGEAIPLIPAKSSKDISKAFSISKGAAQTILAKALVTSAGVDASSPNWQEAYTLCKTVEDSKLYDLKSDITKVFTVDGQYYTNEHMLDIVFEEKINGEGEQFIHFLSPRYVFINGKPDQSQKLVLGFGILPVTQDLASDYGYTPSNLYTPAANTADSTMWANLNDARGRSTFWTRWDKYLGYNVVDNLNNRPETKNPDSNDDGCYYLRKYSRESKGIQYYTAGANLHIIRYPEVLLLGAEAAYYTNKPSEALRLVNLVRERAFRAAIAAGRVTLADISINSSGLALLADIWRERRLEFAGEGDRYYDLKRTNRLYDVLTKQKSAVPFINGKHELLPIPVGELLKATNITQNPGY